MYDEADFPFPDVEPISPLRFFFAIFASATVAQWGLARKSLDKSGAFTGKYGSFVFYSYKVYCA